MDIKKLIPYLFGVAILLFILSRINIVETFKIIVGANLFYVLGAVLLIPCTIALESLRWHYMLRKLGITYPFPEVFTMYCSSVYLGTITPARVGEFVRVSFLKGENIGKSFFTVFLDRASDVLFLIGAGYLGMFLFASFLTEQIFWLSIVFVAGVLLVAFAMLRKDFVKFGLSLVFHRIVPQKFKADVKTSFYDFYLSFFVFIKPQPVIVCFFLTLASWFVYYLNVFLLSKALGISISFFQLATIISIASLLSILPISISGIGTRDAAFVFFFVLLGIKSEFAIALSTLVLLMMLVTALFCFPFWLRKPVNLSFIK